MDKKLSLCRLHYTALLLCVLVTLATTFQTMSSPKAKRSKTQDPVSVFEQCVAGKLAISLHRSKSLIKHYGRDNVLPTVQNNPYQPLIDNVNDVGIVTCNDIANALNIAQKSPLRMFGLIYEGLCNNERQGHSGVPLGKLPGSINDALNKRRQPKCDVGLFHECILKLHDTRAIQKARLDSQWYVFRRSLFLAECRIASVLKNLVQKSPPPWASQVSTAMILQAAAGMGMTPSCSQVAALQLALTSNVVLINGGAGTGKTTLMNLLLTILGTMDVCPCVRLVAPTGLAAERLSHVTGREATTIHRSLGVKWDDDRYHVLILDEATMAGPAICSSMLKSLPCKCTVVFVGDEGQLCPVDAGAVFHFLLKCPIIPSCTLQEVHRQACESSINQFASAIRRGDPPDACLLSNARHKIGDVQFIDIITATECLDSLRHVVTNLQEEGYNALLDVQVLTLKNDGDLGVCKVNACLQDWVNPNAPVTVRGVTYRLGDRLLHTCNDYDRQVMNGNIGTLQRVILGHHNRPDRLWVQFEDRTVSFDGDSINQLQLAYCLTVHKSQGSEFRAVVLLMLDGGRNSSLLRRNLLYTACTRAISKLIIISNTSTLEKAILKTEPRLSGPSVLRKRLCMDDDDDGDDDDDRLHSDRPAGMSRGRFACPW